ncbi:MAG: hypothetical protein FWE27_09910 [Defluviitaleaceae bacterium]|nr:hypothetical protein [Defluviitaleaceae bacterium]
MSNTVMDINALPQLLLQLFSTSRVSVSETDGGIHVVPLKEENKKESSIDGLIGILADYPEMSVDKFLARMREDAELDI